MELKLIQGSKRLYELMDGDRFICSACKLGDGRFMTATKVFKDEEELLKFYKYL